MSDKGLKSIYIYEYVFGDVEHKVRENALRQRTHEPYIMWMARGPEPGEQVRDKDASGHVQSWSIAWETHWSRTIISPSRAYVFPYSQHIESTLCERDNVFCKILQAHRKLGLFSRHLFIHFLAPSVCPQVKVQDKCGASANLPFSLTSLRETDCGKLCIASVCILDLHCHLVHSLHRSSWI